MLIVGFGICLALSASRTAAASASATQPLALPPADAQQLLSVLNDPVRLAALKTTLANLQKAVAATAPKPPLGLPQNSLGAQLVESVDTLGSGLAHEGQDVAQTLRASGDVRPWANGIMHDPARRSQTAAALVRLALLLGMAFGAAAVLHAVVQRPISALARLAGSRLPGRPGPGENDAVPATPKFAIPDPAADAAAIEEIHTQARHIIGFAHMLRALRLLPFGVAHFILELVPIGGFALVAFLFELSGLVQGPQNLVVIQSALGAFVIGGAILALMFSLFAPQRPALRLVPVGDHVARRICFWLRQMVIVAASGIAILNVLQQFGLPDYAASVGAKLMALTVHGLLAILIFRSRNDIADFLQPRRPGQTSSRILLGVLARNTWVILIFYDFALWLTWAAELQHGYTRLLTGTAETALAIAVARLSTVVVFGLLERTGQNIAGSRAWASRVARYYPVMRRIFGGIVLLATLVVVLQAWGVDTLHWFRSGAIGGRLVSASAGVLVAVVAGIITWEAANIGLESRVERLTRDPAGGAARVARLQTLMPILRIILFVFIAVILVMTLLSEIGVNIAPLLGGAGIIGVAIGFGSQKLVQDFITGIFLLLENAMQVGDGVTCAGLSGTVEHLSIRTLHLRAGDGSLIIIPFSSVTTVTNGNRGLGNAPVSVDIAPDQDSDAAAGILKRIVAEMKADPEVGHGMLSELQYWGVDKVTTQAVTLVGQIVCTDAAHDGVRRELNRRMKKAFEEHGIRLAQPTQAVRLIGTPQHRASDADA